MFTSESDSERILKIGQHLTKFWAIKYRVVFLFYETRCIYRLRLRRSRYSHFSSIGDDTPQSPPVPQQLGENPKNWALNRQ